MSEAKPKCCGQVSPPGSYRSYNCGKNASLEHDGKHYCKLHHPPTVWAKRDARNAKWDAEWEEKKKKAAEASTAAEEQKRRADAYGQLVERVKELEEALNCITSMCETHGDFRNGVTDPTGTIDEGNVIAGRIVGDARAVLTKYRTNAADVKEHPGASIGTALPAGWVPLTITHEGQYPEEVAYGPKIMMDRLGKWLGKYFAQIAAPAQMPDLQPLHNLLYLAQRQTSLGAMQRVVSEARLDLAKVRDAALSKARPNTAEGEAHAGNVLEDSARWHEVLNHVGADNLLGGAQYVLRGIQAPVNVMQGSVAQHFTKSIDAARKQAAAKEPSP